jgi:hypothetical protein
MNLTLPKTYWIHWTLVDTSQAFIFGLVQAEGKATAMRIARLILPLQAWAMSLEPSVAIYS